MYVEPLRERGYLTTYVDAEGWEPEQLDRVWLYASDIWLRRQLLDNDLGEASVFEPTSFDIRLGGSGGGCVLLWCSGRYGREDSTEPVLGVFTFAGDLVKWHNVHGFRLGRPSRYRELAEEIGNAAAAHVPGGVRPDVVARFAGLQALIWSVQSLRVEDSPAERVGDLLTELGLPEYGGGGVIV